MRVGRKIVGVAATAAVVYAAWVRPRLMRWGATDEEVTGPYPGASLVPEGERSPTMAVTIDATPGQVWPWLVQLGGDRGGWYSWDCLDNGGRPSATEVHPEWQHLAIGDYVKYWTNRGPVDAWQVAALEPNRFLGLHALYSLRGSLLDPNQPRPSAYLEGLWGFLLNELPDGRTRLVIGGYQAIRPGWLGRFAFGWLYVPVVWPMQARMLAVLKRNIERAARVPAQAGPSGGPLAGQGHFQRSPASDPKFGSPACTELTAASSSGRGCACSGLTRVIVPDWRRRPATHTRIAPLGSG